MTIRKYAAERFRWIVAGLVLLVAAGGFASTAWAEGGNVRYSYEEVRIAGEREFVLVPRAEGNLRGEVTQSTLEQAFEALRRAKRPTYGNSYADVSGNIPRGARVEVHIDSDKRDFAAIIMAEAVYTMTEFGVPEVHFPGVVDGGLTRGDISFAAYTLTIPLWKVIPETKVTSAQVLMPDGELVPLDEVQRRWRAERGEMLDEVYSYLNSEDPWTVRSVVRRLSDYGDLRVDALLPLLTHSTRDVRRQTLEALEGYENDETVLEAVSAALKEESSRAMAGRLAEFLGASESEQYNVEQQFFRIRRGSDEEAVEATRKLSQWDDERVVTLLEELLRDEREDLTWAAVQALEGLKAYQPRLEALEDADVATDVRSKLAEDLAADSNPDRVRLSALSYLARHRSGGHAGQAISAMAELPMDEARQRVEAFLEDDAMARRRSAIAALKSRGDVDSVAGLMAAAEGQPESELMKEAAYGIMLSQPTEEILARTNASSVDVQKLAYQAVGERAARDGASGDVMEILREGVGHRIAEIRGASARAFGEIGGDAALEILEGLLSDSSPVVRRDAALALGNFSDEENARKLVELLDDGDAGVVAAAIDALEQRGDARAADRIRALLEHDDHRVRAAALRGVTTFLDDDDSAAVRRHMGMLSGAVNDDAMEVRLSALEQLGRFELGMAVTNIAIQVSAEDPTLRAAAVRALGDTGHDDARPLLRTALSDRAAIVRREAVDALTRLAGSEARPELEARMEEEDDPEIKELIETHLQQI